MGNFTSSTAGVSSTACVQYVQVSRFLQICYLRSAVCGKCNTSFLLSVFDQFCIKAESYVFVVVICYFLFCAHF